MNRRRGCQLDDAARIKRRPVARSGRRGAPKETKARPRSERTARGADLAIHRSFLPSSGHLSGTHQQHFAAGRRRAKTEAYNITLLVGLHSERRQ
jgi:hypothetical protein